MTFDEFRATGRNVPDIQEALKVHESERADWQRAPGRMYAASMYLVRRGDEWLLNDFYLASEGVELLLRFAADEPTGWEVRDDGNCALVFRSLTNAERVLYQLAWEGGDLDDYADETRQ